MKLSAEKKVLVEKKLEWCRYVVDADGVKYDPRRLNGQHNRSHPENTAELSQFFNRLLWMSNYIPKFASRVAPLLKLLDAAYLHSGKRTSRSVKGVRLSELSWGPVHVEAF